MNLYLCGMIGTGKSSIGRALSKRLGWPFFDVDRWMEREAGKKSIRDIVAEEGWVSYREREYKICRRLAKRKRSVVALAGGTVRYAWNMDVLRGTGVFILLKANLTVMVNRAKGNDRPPSECRNYPEKGPRPSLEEARAFVPRSGRPRLSNGPTEDRPERSR